MAADPPSLRAPATGASSRADTPEADSALAKAYFDYAFGGIIVTDGSLRIVRANPAACSILGRPRHRLMNSALPRLIGEDGQARMRADSHFALLAEQGIARVELALPLLEGEAEPRVIELASIDIGEGRLLHVFDDVSAQRRLALAMEEARRASDEASRAKSSFLANMSHEIRTPLNGVIGLGELLRLTGMDAQQTDYVTKILQSSRALLAILNDVLDLAKVEAGGMEFEQLPFELAAVLDELAATAAPMAQKKGLELSFNVADGTPRCVAGDRLRLLQVMLNLIGNAIKFTERGSVTVSIAAAGVDAGAGAAVAQHWLRFCVSDTGIGLSPEAQARIFSPFSQAEASTTRRFGGTGLGLSISRRLTEGMGGRIEVRSEPGQGSTFCVYLPLEPAPDFASAPAQAAIALGRDEFRGARVLVAEDNAINREVIERLLRYAGIEVSLAATGREALQLLRGREAAPDLIIMDVQMPDMDGLTATRALRGEGRDLPVVAFTAGVFAAERELCKAAGMSDFIAKPIDVDELAAVLTRWLPARGAGLAPQADEENPPAAAQDFDFPGIALDQALPRFLGRRDVLARARDAFLGQHGASPERLAQLNAESDWAQMARIAHALKGAAGNLGALELAARALELEQALQAQDRSRIAALIQSIKGALELMSGGGLGT